MSATDRDAVTLLAIKVVRDRIDLLDKTVRERLKGTLRPGARWPVVVPDAGGVEVEIGGITRTKPAAPKKRARVTDPAAFLAWCLEAYPDEVLWPEPPPPSVRPAFESVVLARCLADDGEPFADPTTGETLDLPPGVDVRVEESSAVSTLQVRSADGGEVVLLEALRAGRVHLPDPLTEEPPAIPGEAPGYVDGDTEPTDKGEPMDGTEKVSTPGTEVNVEQPAASAPVDASTTVNVEAPAPAEAGDPRTEAQPQ